MAKGTQDARYKLLIEGLAGARRKAGMSQAELAAQLGHRQQFVSKYESGERRLDFVEVLDIAKALDIPLQTLIAHVSDHDRAL